MYLSESEYYKKCEALPGKYWKTCPEDRWKYMSLVIDEMKSLGVEKTLEVGTNDMALSASSDVFTYPKQDLDEIPYPYLDKEYDCVVALQVFEHIKNQSAAFKEIMRVSKTCILSLPYKWICNDGIHGGIDEDIISSWTNHEEPVKVIHVDSVCNNPRIIYIWDWR